MITTSARKHTGGWIGHRHVGVPAEVVHGLALVHLEARTVGILGSDGGLGSSVRTVRVLRQVEEAERVVVGAGEEGGAVGGPLDALEEVAGGGARGAELVGEVVDAARREIEAELGP